METLKALLIKYFTPVSGTVVEVSIIPNHEDGACLIPCTDLTYQVDISGNYVVWNDFNLDLLLDGAIPGGSNF